MTEILHKPDLKIAEGGVPAPVDKAVINDRAGQDDYKAAVAAMRGGEMPTQHEVQILPETGANRGASLRPLPDQSSPILSNNTEQFMKFQAIYNRLHDGGMQFADLQNDVQSIVKNMGLPPLSFEIRKERVNEGATAEYAPGQGHVKLVGGLHLDLSMVGTMVHEVTHFEQDLLMARRMMDRLGVAASVSDSQIQQLKKMYGDEVGEEEQPDEQFLRSAVSWRGGRTLSPAEAKRADELIAAMYDFRKTYLGLPGDFERDMVRDLPKLFELESPRESVKRLLDEAQTGNGIIHIGLFGLNRKITSQDIIAQFGDPKDPSFDSDRAAQALAEQVKAREAEFQHQLDVYVARKHEAEAIDVAAQFKRFAAARGADPNGKSCSVELAEVRCGQ